MDAELEAGVPDARERYLNAAAMAMREPEEWELYRLRPLPGDRMAAHAFISDQRMAMCNGRRDAALLLESEYRQLERALIDADCDSIYRVGPSIAPERAGNNIAVYGTVRRHLTLRTPQDLQAVLDSGRTDWRPNDRVFNPRR